MLDPEQFRRIHLVVLSYNRSDCLPRLFEEVLLPAASSGVRVTVVDNASGTPVRDFLSRFTGRENVSVIFNSKNLGVSGGRNTAFRVTEREIVVCMDDDSLIDLEALQRVPRIFDELPEMGILAFRVIHGLTGEAQNEHGYKRGPVGNFHEAGFAVRRTVFERAGYLDETCMFGAEGLEFSMRGRRWGIQTVYTPEIVVRHFGIPRSGKESSWRIFNWVQSYATVLFRYLPLSTAFLFSLRLLVNHVYDHLHERRIGVALVLPWLTVVGAAKGIVGRTPLDARAVALYSDPNTRPQLGNVPIGSKYRGRLLRKVRKILLSIRGR